MELEKRWDRLVEGIDHLRQLLLQHRFATVGASPDESEIEAAANECYEALECVLAARDDHSLLLKRLKNAREYFDEGERWSGVWEVTQALRQAKKLRSFHGCD